jgi:hypothetical protein
MADPVGKANLNLLHGRNAVIAFVSTTGVAA